MRIEEAKQILNKNGYLLKEDAFRNNTDMSSICAIMDAHGWSPEFIIERIKDYYYNVYLKPKAIKSTKRKYTYENFYRPGKKDDWWNVDLDYIIDELLEDQQSYATIGLSNFNYCPYISDKDEPVLDEDDLICNKLDDALEKVCKKCSSNSSILKIKIGSDGMFTDEPGGCFADIDIALKKEDLTSISKNEIKEELINVINDIVTDKELNKVEYDAASAALKAEEEL